eukprot:c12618_g1_i1.p1 GENE.c12618_g1_i1~~c12618_g1_i1.p1  ORF type:complete len:2339 (-),score=583.56 c12618_g1_i1:437-7453(-)
MKFSCAFYAFVVALLLSPVTSDSVYKFHVDLALSPLYSSARVKLNRLTLPTEAAHCSTNGADYYGTKNVTISGSHCIDWPQVWIEAYPLANLESPLCRNPDQSDAPWCFVADGVKANCNVSDSLVPENQRITAAQNFDSGAFNLSTSADGSTCANGAFCAFSKIQGVGCYVCNNLNTTCLPASTTFKACSYHTCCTTCGTIANAVLSDTLDRVFTARFDSSEVTISILGRYRLMFNDNNAAPRSGVSGLVRSSWGEIVSWSDDVRMIDFSLTSDNLPTIRSLTTLIPGSSTALTFFAIGGTYSIILTDCAGFVLFSVIDAMDYIDGNEIPIYLPNNFVVTVTYLDWFAQFELDLTRGETILLDDLTTVWNTCSGEDFCVGVHSTSPPAISVPLPGGLNVSQLAPGLFISPDGNDDHNDGSSQYPLRSPVQALNQLTTSGFPTNTIYLFPGVHPIDECYFMTIAEVSPPCIQITMYDSYGDGWSGQFIQLYSLTGRLVTSITLVLASQSSRTACFPYQSGFFVTVTSGLDADELSWKITEVTGGKELARGNADTSIFLNTPPTEYLRLNATTALSKTAGLSRVKVYRCGDRSAPLAIATIGTDVHALEWVAAADLLSGFEVVVELDPMIDQSGYDFVQNSVTWTLDVRSNTNVSLYSGVGHASIGCGPKAFNLSSYSMDLTTTPTSGADVLVANCLGNVLVSSRTTQSSSTFGFNHDLSNGLIVYAKTNGSANSLAWTIRLNDVSILGNTTTIKSGVSDKFYHTCPFTCASNQVQILIADKNFNSSWTSAHKSFLVTNCANTLVANVSLAGLATGPVFACLNESEISGGFKVQALSSPSTVSWAVYYAAGAIKSGTTSSSTTSFCPSTCINPRHGNGICDTDLNVSPCWDGGDCCVQSCTVEGCQTHPKDCRKSAVKLVGLGDVVLDGGAGTFRADLFTAHGGSLTVENIKFRNIKFISESTLFVADQTATLTLKNCTFENVTSQVTAIVEAKDCLTRIANSTFSNTKASTNGAVTVTYGSITSLPPTLLIRDTVFESTGSTLVGGALYFANTHAFVLNCTFHKTSGYIGPSILGSSSSLYLLSSTVSQSQSVMGGTALDAVSGQVVSNEFISNSARYGGGITLLNSNSMLISSNSFSHNTANMGAGIYCQGGVLQVTGGTMSSNNASINGGGLHSTCPTIISASTFTNNSAANGGGASVQNNYLKLSNSEFNANKVTNAGGALYLSQIGVISIPSSVDSTFQNNTGGLGGALYMEGHSAYLRVNMTLTGRFANNVATAEGGAVTAVYAAITSADAVFNANSATLGGAIRLFSTSSSFLNLQFASNQAVSGGALAADGVLNITSCILTYNTASETGGAIVFANATSRATMKTVTLTHNTAGTDGGAIYSSSNALSLLDSTFTANAATARGGAIYGETMSSGSFSNNVFVQNTAFSGGGVWVVLSSLDLENNTFMSNSATEDGGGLYTSSVGPTSVVNRNVFFGNSAKIAGGGIVASSSQHSLTNSHFTNNHASTGGAIALSFSPLSVFSNNVINNNQGDLYGGGMYLINSRTTFAHSTISGNSAPLGGGIAIAQYIVTPAVLYNLTVSNNTATTGGGLLVTDSKVNIASSIFSENSAQQCGAVLATRVNISITDSSFVGNHVSEAGGAVCVNDFFAVSLDGSTFSSNTAVDSGGALVLEKSLVLTPVTISNCVFSVNEAGVYGGAFQSNVNTVCTNVQFLSNSGDAGGGAVYHTTHQINFTRCVFDGNSAIDGEGGALLASDGHAAVVNSIFSSNSAHDGGAAASESSLLEITACNFVSNRAQDNGGAVLLTKAHDSILSSCTFTNNNASTGDGGALSVDSSNHIVVSNTTFSANSASKGSGGALHVFNSPDRTISASNTYSANVAGFGASLSSGAHTMRLTSANNITTVVGQFFSKNVVVTLYDEYGQIVTTESSATASIADQNGHQLFGSLVTVFSHGVATFDSLTITQGCSKDHTLLITTSIANITAVTLVVHVDCKLETLDYWGFVVAVGIFVFVDLLVAYIVFVNRFSPVIARSSPMFCFLQLLGDLLILVGIIPWVVSNSSISCSFAVALWAIGFTLAYGSLFLKTWRIMKLFGNHSLSRLVLPNEFLLGWLTVLLTVDLILLVAIFATTTPHGRLTNLPYNESSFEVCFVSQSSVPLALLLVVKVCLLLYGVGLSFRVSRLFKQNFSADKKDFNESRHIQYCLNNTLLFLIVIFPVIYSLQNSQWKLQLSLIAVAVIATSQFNALILFPPKILKLYRLSLAGSAESRNDASRAKRLATLFFPKVVFPSQNNINGIQSHPTTDNTAMRKPTPSVSVGGFTNFGPIVETPSELL